MKWIAASSIFFLLGGIAIIAASVGGGGGILPGPDDQVTAGFDSYERLWRETSADGGKRLRAGEHTTDTEARGFLSESQKKMREIAFGDIARNEAEALNPWSPEKHAEILEGYAR